MTELRAVEAGSAIKALARATYEYLAWYGSLLLFALLCLGWSLLQQELERYYRSELQPGSSSCR